jgi:hypothetical protein
MFMDIELISQSTLRELAPRFHLAGCCGIFGPVPSATLDKFQM